MPAEKIAALLRGQRYVWLRHQHLPPDVRAESNIVRRLPVPEGTPLSTIRTTLNYLIRRHEGLRTTYHFDSDGEPRQVVHPPAPLSVPTVSTERDGTPGPAQVVAELSGTAFELAKEWPLRACVLTTGGQPTHIVLVLNHMALDAWSVELLEQELEALRAGAAAGRPAVLRPIRHQPLDLARHEASPEGRAARDRSAAYWRAELAGVPTDGLAARRRAPDPAGGHPLAHAATAHPLAHAATLTSPALLEATRRIAERHHVWPSLVHLTAHAQALLAYTGAERLAHLFFTGNRESCACPDVLTCTFSPALISLDGSGERSFGDLLVQLAHRVEQAGAHADLPYDELLELLATESARRGTRVRVGAELNFLSHNTHRSRASRTVLTRQAEPTAWAAQGSDTLLRVYELRDAVVVGLNARASVLDGEAVIRFLRGYEALVLAQLDPAADLRRADVAALFDFASPEPAVHREPSGLPSAGTPDRDLDRAAEAGRVLALVVGQVNELPAVELAEDYVTAGGRALRIPRVQRLLAEHGWGGLNLDELLSGRPLAELARAARWIG